MNRSPHSHSRIGSTLARIALVFGVLFLALLIGAFVAGAAALRSLNPSTEMGALRSELLNCLEEPCLSSIEVTLPSWVAALGRVSASFADVDPQIKAAIRSVGGAQVGIYELTERPPRHKMMAMLDVADLELEPKGWTRMVTVLDDNQLVTAYGPESSLPSEDKIELLVIVIGQRELVIVSAKGYTGPLIELASSALSEVGCGDLALNTRGMQ